MLRSILAIIAGFVAWSLVGISSESSQSSSPAPIAAVSPLE